MSRKHFIAIAKSLAAIRPAVDSERVEQWKDGVNAMANVCRSFNPQFDRERFLEACHE